MSTLDYQEGYEDGAQIQILLGNIERAMVRSRDSEQIAAYKKELVALQRKVRGRVQDSVCEDGECI